jgi:hypothetical protein
MVEEYALSLVLGRLGPAGPIIRDLLRQLGEKDAEIDDLKAQNEHLALEVQARRTMKARSPAVWRFRVLSWELGEQVIYPTEFPEGKKVPNLRIHIPLDDPSEGAPYWDITSKKVIATLLPILPSIARTNTYVEVRKDGEGRSSSYSVSVQPA